MGLVIIVSIVVPVGILWTRGIDNMKKKYPDYKGEDFLNWDRKNDSWEDSKIYGKGDF